jgi:hypothetical protein
VLEQELLRIGLVGQAARELKRGVQMVVDHPRRDHAQTFFDVRLCLTAAV